MASTTVLPDRVTGSGAGSTPVWSLRFWRSGQFDVALPVDHDERDWPMVARVTDAVRQAMDPDTVTLPIQPTTGAEDTMPLSAWFDPDA